MGFLDRFTKAKPAERELMSDEQSRKLGEMQAMLNAAVAANPGALPDLSDPDKAAEHGAAAGATRERIERLAQHGVDAPGVIRSVRPTGGSDLGGGREVEVAVTIQPPGVPPIEATAVQSLPPGHLERLTVGRAVTVKHDPGAPGHALLVDW